jgi:3-deoxy-manno-octulosonate cytidylyltransferase (CMP-KDO synthetase)
MLPSAISPGRLVAPGKKVNVAGNVITIIPARYASTRFPGKALTLIGGKPMIVRVLERVRGVRGVSRVLVATDDARIADAVRAAGGEAVMTRSDHASGTERIAEVAESHIAPLYMNVQGDEPLMEPTALEDLIAALPEEAGPHEDAAVVTLATPLRDPLDAADPRIVKVVTDFNGCALYFSRASIPHTRESAGPAAPAGERKPPSFAQWKHLGVYLYRRAVLLAFPMLSPGRLERLEQLEQLRLLEHGYRIRVIETPYDCVSVDVPADVQRVEALLKGKK